MPNTQPLPARNLHIGQHTHTPLVPVQLDEQSPTIWAKLEFLNPSGSTKDRVAIYILTKAFRDGTLTPGSCVIEASSGSTSIAMAMVCAQLGLRFIAVMPQGVSNERSMMIKAYGGEVRFSPRDKSIGGSIELAQHLAAETGAFLPRQFENPDNVNAHRFGTAQEIVQQIPGHHVDAVISGVGTGGTLVGLYLGCRDLGCRARPILAKPVSVAGHKGYCAGCFTDAECCAFSGRIPGVIDKMSRLFQPDQLEALETIEIEDTRAIQVTRQLIGKGFPVGPSSGLNLAAAIEAAKLFDADATLVTVFPDRMERYFSTELFAAPSQNAATDHPCLC